MNCPSRSETEPEPRDGWNQNPPYLAADLTTNSDMNGRANSIHTSDREPTNTDDEREKKRITAQEDEVVSKGPPGLPQTPAHHNGQQSGSSLTSGRGGSPRGKIGHAKQKVWEAAKKYASFIGPGMMVAVAYIDPGNYATDVAAGASYQYKLLFTVLLANILAIFLQSLCIKLGSVTGMNLAENCRAHLPKWLNIILYIFAEAAIIATDIAEVIGTAISLNVLGGVPLVAGCAISIVDVVIILAFYRPESGMKGLRVFEYFVMLLVLGVVVCFCIQLSELTGVNLRTLFRGFAPSSAVVDGTGLYQSCGILGATVMPHSLYLGSGIVQARLKEFDVGAGGEEPAADAQRATEKTSPFLAMKSPYAALKMGLERVKSIDVKDELSFKKTSIADDSASESTTETKYQPSLAAIKSCLGYSITELAISLFTFALFVNSSILIVAGASLYNAPGAASADLFGIHDLLAREVNPAAGTIFALALLLSGISAGIVCTIAGQMVSEGQLNWTCKPWLRRLITRSISITPSIIVAGATGKEGLSAALEGSQVALSIILPFVSAPLLWFTCRSYYMQVTVTNPQSTARDVTDLDGARSRRSEEGSNSTSTVNMRNSWLTTGFAIAVWLLLVVMNVALLVLVGMGKQ